MDSEAEAAQAWARQEQVEGLRLQVIRLSAELHRLDHDARTRLALVQQRSLRLQRRLDHVAATVELSRLDP